MVTLWFKPGPSKLKVVKAIKDTLKVSLREARDAVELGRIECVPSYRERLIKAMEAAGAKLT